MKRKQDGVVDPEDLRQKSKLKVFEKANSGVEMRDKQDKLQLKVQARECLKKKRRGPMTPRRVTSICRLHEDETLNVNPTTGSFNGRKVQRQAGRVACFQFLNHRNVGGALERFRPQRQQFGGLDTVN